MKKITLFTILALMGFITWAQEKNFEGMVKYESKTKGVNVNEIIQSTITAKFKYPYIKESSSKNFGNSNIREILFDFDKGKIYYIDDVEKKILVYNLYPHFQIYSDLEIDSSEHKILAENIQAVLYVEKHHKQPSKFWYAESLFFNIDNKYATHSEIPLFTNGKYLGLGMVAPDNEFGALATEVIPQELNDAEFALPKNYKIIDYTTK